MSFKLFCIIIAELEQIIAKLKNEIKNHDEAQQYAKIINMTKKEYQKLKQENVNLINTILKKTKNEEGQKRKRILRPAG